MTAKNLGRLEKVELRNVWPSEASNFTPWLAVKENLDILGATLGIDLELEARESPVGPFRADILCKDAGTDRWVLIENQLEKTDHTHLGQLLTYASGLEAVTIVWIAARFTEEHRSTLDWLNRISDESFRFFGLEVELWRIGDSPAAPKFNLVSKPNDWSQSVAQAARAIDDAALSDTRIRQLAYWTAFDKVLASVGGPISAGRMPQPKSWMGYSIGRSHFNLAAVMRPKKRIQAELYIKGTKAKAFYHLLAAKKDDIERDLGFGLSWEELPEGQDSRISVGLDNADAENEADWPRQHEWLAKRLNEMHRVLAPRVSLLDPDSWKPESESALTNDIETLVAYCRDKNRICPMPDPWNQLWEMLPDRERVGAGWQPPPPLILAAWTSPTASKMARLAEHIEWAAKHGALGAVERFLQALSEDEWFHLND